MRKIRLVFWLVLLVCGLSFFSWRPSLASESLLQLLVCGRGDINCDGKVDVIDFSILLSNWGALVDTRTDLNSDGVVDVFDLSILMSNWTG